MIILGIDPGIARTGYAFLKHTGKETSLLECGCITTKAGTAEPARLLEIKKDLTTLIKKLKPDSACIESLFFETNVKTAMTVGQARGMVMVTLAEAGLKMIEVTPLQVKMSTTGYGKADKKQVQTMIVKLLKLKKIPKPDDAADACAIAWSGIGR
ncbi:MAG: crossover junction endodeoxyribonuclease RuvC [Candidatus Doudnabacteria bacterium RIFCSPLOWO2_02_FULL_49_13]|uniref:Crossover junction endodeoxyribonuclease RuvC n=1 Tax=Candidatus Doudnabacteria bacterium RIFCSPHIGHO2_12_FULL_48_16 TaxID=1817838 RepID=A0A1F5PKH3_9BACT|nr:MAG: crossover junction endodeoxyribonuclease RuvC [Candidatus Doudnabacteria bacterium RIFCSPHIGHO2_01_FULL_50_67]OGE88890.1 MAG: crossover junction endodeoxyribonuclease RuvC [Candidatus Doudnabacteria bacterium RIFCSPHIGHO2_02_FULL_49_24]OGE90304.1 MAG: crossover junction endodeoxyribonuclease RuvC [Candidatus Doudnabacteria bacterium RIFCSPHIGHO2_12_FULL_48_16]OGE96732.1 MAG: crossover junction endodeoxyribonuclease RuvC [Candidatus Doudnabacteria bacterium RIFCSPLOWO2_01_FULL_49_40]OGF0